MLCTIGYEGASLDAFIRTLIDTQVRILIDVRDRAQSRRKGFSKRALAAALDEAGIEYLHLRELGDPKEGRDAARAGDYARFRHVYADVLKTPGARAAITRIGEIAAKRVACLMCYERDPRECHRSIVASRVARRLGGKPCHLGVRNRAGASEPVRRMRDYRQSAAA